VGDVFVVASVDGFWNGQQFVSDWRDARHFTEGRECRAAAEALDRAGLDVWPHCIIRSSRRVAVLPQVHLAVVA
jgi:hypothetical protein